MPYSLDQYSARSISPAAYLDFVEQKVKRIFYNQLPESVEYDALQGIESHLLAFYYQDELIEVAKISLLPYLRIYRRAQLNWLADLDGLEEHLPGILRALENFLLEQQNCLVLTICPMSIKTLHGAKKEDLAKFDAAKSERIHTKFIKSEYEHIDYDFYSNTAVQPKFIFVKKLSGMTEEQAFADLDSKVRSHMRVCERFNIQIRELRENEAEVFNQIMLAMAENYGFDKLRLTLVSPEELRLARSGQSKKYYAIYLNIAESLAFNEKMQREIEAEIAANPAESRREKQAVHNLKQQAEANQKRRQEILELEENYPQEEELILGVSEFTFSKSDFICLQTAVREEFVRLSPAYRAHSLMLAEAIRQGADYYNFFAVSDPQSPEGDEGVLRFKEQFNGYTEEYTGTYLKTLRDPLPARILKAAKNLFR